jgi:uncharacterized membrane protein
MRAAHMPPGEEWTMATAPATDSGHRQLAWSAALIGIGIMAAIDEIVFHQLLGWHHFFDRSTSDIGLLSDGLLHAAELIALVAGFFMLMDLRDRGQVNSRLAWAWFLIGAGGFQVFDALVDHKILRVHQIRYGVDTLPYDIAWIASGILLLVPGLILLRRTRTAVRERM